jgi:hypothetical protein
LRLGPPAPRLLLTGNRREDRRRGEFWRKQQAHGWPILRRPAWRQELAEQVRRARQLDELITLARQEEWETRTAKRLAAVGITVAPTPRRRRHPGAT